MKQWYVLQVLTGKEEEIARKLGQHGIDALLPREYVSTRKGGEWKDQVRLLLPGYVLIHIDYNPSYYYTFHAALGIIRILNNNGTPIPLTPQEEAYWTQGDWQPSKVQWLPCGAWKALDGPLSRIPISQVIKISRRQRRARVRLQAGVITVIKDLSIEIV